MFTKSLGLASLLLASSLIVDSVSALYNPAGKGNTVVYWGQNAYGSTTQNDLFTTCNDTNVDIVVLSFVTKFKGTAGYPVINLSNQCGNLFKNATTGKDTDILTCPDIGDMVTQCQAIGKKVLLSIGGATYTGAGWPDVTSARSSANEIWSMFGPPSTFPYRPFANASFDGFDLDFEYVANAKNSDAFAAQLRAKFALDKKKTYLLTAAPQCPNPDPALNTALTKVPFDAVFIQFYNANCGAQTWKAGAAQTTNQTFNFQLWQKWATTSSNNKNIKLFTGFLAGGVGGNTGYVARTTAQKIVAESMKSANFGGASFWDSSILNVNVGYLPAIRSTLNSTIIKREAEPEPKFFHPVNTQPQFPDKGIMAKAAAAVIRKGRKHHHHRRTQF